MKKTGSLFRASLVIALASLTASGIFLLTGMSPLAGPALAASFVFLAIGCYGFPALKKYAYTVWIFAAVTVSMNYPGPFREIGNLELKVLIIPLLQIIMFGMGSQLSVANFRDVVRMPAGVVAGIFCQFTIMPLVGFALARSFHFPPEIAAGIILVGSSPSGLASNVMSFIARANLALSVTLTATATLLAPLMTPLLMKWLAGQYVPVDFWGMMLGIVNMVILPIVAGLIFHAVGYGKTPRRKIIVQAAVYLVIILLKNYLNLRINEPGFTQFLISTGKNVFWFSLLPVLAALVFRNAARGDKRWLDRAMSLVSMVGIGIIITIITANGREGLLTVGGLLIVACLIHNFAGYSLGYWICRMLGMDERSCRTIGLEVGMQNAGLASGIALEMGKVATVGLAPAVFGPMMNITGSSLATWWRAKLPGGPQQHKPQDD